MMYRLECTDCRFTDEIEGDAFAVLDRIDEHHDRVESGRGAHVVEFEVVEW